MPAFHQLLFGFFMASGILGLICVYILTVMNQEQKHANRLLSVALLTLSYTVVLNGFTYVPGFFEQYPHFWRSALPLHYLFAPLFYLYIRATIRQELGFRLWDWLHFLPALLHLVELMPFYLQPAEEKVAYMRWLLAQSGGWLQHREGILPPWIHPIIKTAVGSGYVLAAVRLLTRFRMHSAGWRKENQDLWWWLKWLTTFLGVLYGFMLVMFLFHDAVPQVSIMVNVPITLILFLATATLVFKPRVLYGIFGYVAGAVEEEKPPALDHTEPVPIQRVTLSPQKVALFREQLDNYLAEEKPYLSNKFPIRDLAFGCGVPPHFLSAVINREYGMSYNDFINMHRVQYIIRHRHSSRWQDYTLEAIALEAGFNSRSTFINAFKKVTGSTPSSFFAQNRINEAEKPV